VTFFSEDRMAELRELFFESAQELLQALNEEGLELEKRPGDEEVVRRVRRTVHTLKGDSAAVGYRELSALAHQLEDVLTPELAQAKGGAVAEVVLSAADIFNDMLAAYRGNVQPPAGDPLRAMISRLSQQTNDNGARVFQPSFAWTEYERLIIAGALDQGRRVYNIAALVDPACPMKAAALQLFRNALQEAGSVLAMRPEDHGGGDTDVIEAALSSEHTLEWLGRKCRIPAVVAELRVEPFPAPAESQPAVPAAPAITEPAPVAASAPEPVADVAKPETPRSAAAAASENTLRVDAERVDTVLNLMGELIISKSMLHQAFNEFTKQHPKDPVRGRFADAMAFQARVLNELQRAVMKIRMVPVEQLFRRFPRLVRDICKQRGRDAALAVTGQDTDLDKSVLDALAEPLAHLVRNAVDHGLESAEERIAAGKPAQGTVRLNAYHHGNQVIIEVSDDGRGIDRQKVVARALEKGMLTAEEAARLSEHDTLNLIFESGFSTAEQITAISGRGVGMDVVRSVLERLKGTIAIQTTVGQGTTFLLKVPLTLAIIKALLFRVNGKLYAVPLNSVLEIARASESEVHRVDNREVLQLRGHVLTLVRMGRLVAGQPSEKKSSLFVVVLGMADRQFGLVVDKLEGEEELVIKALDDRLVATDLVSGASIMGDGTVVLILNISAVLERVGRTNGKAARSAAGGAP
jgi:two-component system chemotaxis sensor kinase CheA